MAVCCVCMQHMHTHTCLWFSNEIGPTRHCGLYGSAWHTSVPKCETYHCIGSAPDVHTVGDRQGHNHCTPYATIDIYCPQSATHYSVAPPASADGPVGTVASKLQRQGVKCLCWSIEMLSLSSTDLSRIGCRAIRGPGEWQCR